MDMAKGEYLIGKNRVQAAVDNMALSFLEIKPKFVDRAREMFEYECQFFLDDAGDEPLQDCMNRVFTDWILFESEVFDSPAIQYYLANFGASAMRTAASSSRWARIKRSASSVSMGCLRTT